MDTDYFCQLFEMPADWATTKRHLIRFETLFADGNKEFIHHWTVNECSNEIVGYLKNKQMMTLQLSLKSMKQN